MKSIFVVFALLSSQAMASQIPSTYECTVRIFASDLPDGNAEATFDRPLLAGSHGGEGNSLTFGDHQVDAAVDGKWRNLTWSYKGKIVAATVTVTSEVITGYQTLILYNPANTDEEVSIACGPKVAEP